MSPSPRFCIYGAGAVGGMIGGLLAQAGATVSMVARDKTLATLQRDGLTIITAGETVRIPVRASAHPEELGPQDFVVVAVKAPALPEVASRIGPLLGPDTAVMTAMNGVPWWFFANDNGSLVSRRLKTIDPDGAIGRVIPASRVIGCAVYFSAALEGPGIIRHNAHRQLILGEADGELTRRLWRLVYWLRRAGFECTRKRRHPPRHLAQVVGQSQHQSDQHADRGDGGPHPGRSAAVRVVRPHDGRGRPHRQGAWHSAQLHSRGDAAARALIRPGQDFHAAGRGTRHAGGDRFPADRDA